MQRKITKASVEAAIRDAQKRGAKVYLWDTELRGFGFYASPRGNASWLAQKWKGGKAASGGRPVRWVIGQYPHVQPEDGVIMLRHWYPRSRLCKMSCRSEPSWSPNVADWAVHYPSTPLPCRW
jgi:hypothetical protein